MRLIGTNRKSFQTKDCTIAPKESPRLTTIARFTVIDKLFNRFILPPKPFVNPISSHFLLYILFCVCNMPNKENDASSSATVPLCFFSSVCFDGIPVIFKKDHFTVVLFAGFGFFFFFNKQSPAAVLTTRIRSVQNAAC